MSKLTAVVITHNEEENIGRCLKSVRELVDEIVVVDSGSTDKTIEIAKKFGAKIYSRKFDNFAGQRNYSIEKANGEWIISLDADEVVTKALAKEIKNSIQDTQYLAFFIPRRNIIFGKEIKHARWSPDKHIWLFKKSKAKFVGKIHEEVKVNGNVGDLINSKIHYSHKNVGEFLAMLTNYTEFEAEKLVKSGKKFEIVKMLYFAKRSFIGRYFYKRGFLDGWQGFTLSYLRAVYILTVWVKVWEKQNQ